MKKTPGDSYDLDDKEEFDSEREILKGKQNGYRRSGPQVQASQIFKYTQCQYQLKDKKSLEKHKKGIKNFKLCVKNVEKFSRKIWILNFIQLMSTEYKIS